jgi:hypothetical protein
MSLEEIANQLVMLAQLTDRHGAPVALRAIQDMLKIRKILEDQSEETPPMFVLPEGTSVKVGVEEPDE